MSCINVPSYLLNGDGSDMFNKYDIMNTVNQFYTDIVCVLFEASCVAIHRKKYNFYKYWWDEELVLLKVFFSEPLILLRGRQHSLTSPVCLCNLGSV